MFSLKSKPRYELRALVCCDDLVEEASVNQLLQEELDIAEFGVLDAQTLEHAEVAILYSHEDWAKVFQVWAHQVQSRSEIFDRLWFWNNRDKLGYSCMSDLL